MPDTATHTPKYAALEAYQRGLLSPEGAQRLERHLSACGTCQSALEAVAQYALLRQAATLQQVPDLSWDKLERALDAGPPVARPPRRTFRAVAWPALAVAAAVLLVWFMRVEAPVRRKVAPPTKLIARPAPAAKPVEGWVTLAGAEAEIEQDGQRTKARTGARVREGAVLRTGGTAELHVALGSGSAVVVESESEVQLTRLRAAEVSLALRQGSSFQRVKSLAEAERFEVTFGEFTARVRGTRYRVEHAEESAVSVFEGRVLVSRGEALLADLSAGERWSSRSAPDPRGGAPGDRTVHGWQPESQSWSSLALPESRHVRTWHLGDSSLAALGALSMRLPPGEATLHFDDTRGRRHTLAVTIAPEGSALEETHIRELVAQQDEPLGHLDPAEIEPVVHGGLSSMRRCYERSLRRDPSLVGKLKLAIRVAPDGHVSRVALQHDEAALPVELENCIELEARSWRFPRPRGGFVAFEVPLNLRAK